MQARHHALIGLSFVGVLIGCASPPPPPPPKPVGPPTDTVRVPLTDLLTKTYFGHPGGLYPGGINQPPANHDSAARARRKTIQPLDVNGDESPFGKYVLLSIGMANTTQEWCSQNSGPPCTAWSFMGKAGLDPGVNHNTLVIVNGAAEGQDAPGWTSSTSPSYDRIKVGRLGPLGLSENQVQAVWVKLEDQMPALSLPADSADAYLLLTNLGQVMRSLRARYPMLKIVFVSSRSYGGYATTDLNPEPFAYESAFSVKWLIESQIDEMRGKQANPRVGTLDYTKKAASIIVWGPYLWADGATPRSDGVQWNRADFEEDGTHPSQMGESKVAGMLLDFFKTSPYSKCWFAANQYCL